MFKKAVTWSIAEAGEWGHLHPFRLINPGVGGACKLESKSVALVSLLGALYALGVIFLAPISFQIFQVRIADMLLPLSICFGMPAVIGLTLGTVVANLASPFGLIDIGGGTLANFIATYLAWRMSIRWRFKGSKFLATLVQTFVIVVIVGSYLQLLLKVPAIPFMGFEVPGLFFVWLGILIGSLISINLAGYGLLKAVELRLGKAK